ncbi:MAG: ATP-binding protein, partial [Myxococcota bacterium]
MKKFAVDVQPDFIKAMASVTGRPLTGVLELVWNAFDADATEVAVSFEDNKLDGLTKIRVTDNGTGIDPAHVETYFGSLGGSWKQTKRRTAAKRVLHGSHGKGRFKAFGLGDRVEWTTTFGDERLRYGIVGHGSDIKNFEMTDAIPLPSASTGTEVTVENLESDFPSLRGGDAVQNVAEAVAVYLELYPNVVLRYDGKLVDPKAVQAHRAVFGIGPVETPSGPQKAELLVIEWRTSATRRLYLCDEDGCTLSDLPPGIHAPGHSFTAYLKSAYIRELEAENVLAVGEMHEGLAQLLDAAKRRLKHHIAERDATKAAETIRRWQAENVYPYAGTPASPVEVAERQVFDVVALNIDERLPDFSERDIRGRQLTFRLVRQALEESPEALAKILTEVLDLPVRKREEFAALLQRTSLSAIINASKVVADRLDFIGALNKLVFDPQLANVLQERTQLHRILASETWVFGEEYNLMVDDKGLTEVLRLVLEREAPEVTLDSPVRTHTGGAGIVDLMFGRAKKHWGATGREYLVVELKRPTVKIDNKALQQCWKYADALVNHPKFASTNTRWDFWALSVELDDFAMKATHQKNRPPGLYMDDPEGRYRIWAMDWGTVIREAESRHQFFKEQLEIEVQDDDAVKYLRETYNEYLSAEPPVDDPAVGGVVAAAAEADLDGRDRSSR